MTAGSETGWPRAAWDESGAGVVGAIAPRRVRLRSDTSDWPAQVELVLSAIETGRFTPFNRRRIERNRVRLTAFLRLYSDLAASPARTLYVRDLHARGLGFISASRLPLGHGGVIELPTADDHTTGVACTLLRCREAVPGWYEGALYFNRDQPGWEVDDAS